MSDDVKNRGSMTNEEFDEELEKQKPEYLIAECLGEQALAAKLNKYSKHYELIAATFGGVQAMQNPMSLISNSVDGSPMPVPRFILIFRRKEFVHA